MILLPSLLAAEAGGRKRFELEAGTLGAALRALPIANLLFDEHGELRRLVNVYVDGEDARRRLDEPLGPGQTVRIVAAIAGGAPETATPPKERLDRGTGSGLGDAARVIVLNDNHNTFEGVAVTLSSILPVVSFEQGLRLANRIHNEGSAIVWSGTREPAELYWQQLKAAGLTMAPLD